ncbi:phospholipid/cholesterol/gamma-HCH transport system substrate-binding protein [Nocardioides terrae]|uniref:Phospholipid/cholesterol/gamma-HCH transport system substrate-binding protein n=1 Tax=Nocardioides terrae TaxID=574651 RepID=A0A1I1KI20_9ACTN|nr:phospholipid/cholesterol/gamma-HCH transport system substrate-binding protein [Nocardioides terrae]
MQPLVIPFRERNPVKIGAISIAVLALVMLAAFKAQDLPLIGGGDTYYADFSEAGGLKADDEVRIAGVRVGKVTDVGLDHGHVKVTFKLKSDADFGSQTRASIKVKTLLGAMFLALEPAGPGQLAEGAEIPVERTQSPYDVVQAFTGLADTAGDIDTDQLASALTTLSDLTRTTPASFRAALTGVSALSRNVAAKNERIGTLLSNLQRVSAVLDRRDGDIVGLMEDADVLFDALVQRRQAIHDLLTSTSTLSKELSALIDQSREDLKPALSHLQNVLAVLTKNEDNLDESLRLMAPFYRVFASTLGNGPWFDTYIQNMPPAPAIGGAG